MFKQDGNQCPTPASHVWGSLYCCCHHFDLLMQGVFDTKESVHAELIRRCDSTGRPSTLPSALCKRD